MQKYFSLEGGVYRSLTLVKDLILLNVMMILTSIPILTIGASLSAAYSVCFKLVNGESVDVRKSYLDEFKGKFKISTQVFMIFIFMSILFIGAIRLVRIEIISFPLLILFAMFLLLHEIIYPIISLSSFSLKTIYFESFSVALSYLVHLVLSFILTIIWLLWPIYLIKLSFVWLILGGGLTIYLKAKLFNRFLTKRKFIKEKEDD